MEILITAFLLGLMGSFHCVGMCGPIALSLPLRGDNFWQKAWGGLLYNFGRSITYGIKGAFFGLIGFSFSILGFQKGISITMGSFMIASVLIPKYFKKRKLIKFEFITIRLNRALQRLFKMRSYKGLFLIGLANGVLPCGLVYLALAGAVGTGSAPLGMGYMILFGLGTLPMMMLIALIGNVVSIPIRNKMNKVVPYIIVIIGLIFILRGLTLGIPYLSPAKEKLTTESHMSTTPIKPSDALQDPCCTLNPEEKKK